MGSSSHCGQMMSEEGGRGEEEEDISGAPSEGGPFTGMAAQPRRTCNHVYQTPLSFTYTHTYKTAAVSLDIIGL